MAFIRLCGRTFEPLNAASPPQPPPGIQRQSAPTVRVRTRAGVSVRKAAGTVGPRWSRGAPLASWTPRCRRSACARARDDDDEDGQPAQAHTAPATDEECAVSNSLFLPILLSLCLTVSHSLSLTHTHPHSLTYTHTTHYTHTHTHTRTRTHTSTHKYKHQHTQTNACGYQPPRRHASVARLHWISSADDALPASFACGTSPIDVLRSPASTSRSPHRIGSLAMPGPARGRRREEARMLAPRLRRRCGRQGAQYRRRAWYRSQRDQQACLPPRRRRQRQ